MDTSPPSSRPVPAREERLLSSPRSRRAGYGSMAGRVILNILWVLAHFIFSFVIQLTELFAPILLVIGAGWALIPHLLTLASRNLGSLTEDPQTHEIITRISQTLPDRLAIAGHNLTPRGLITDGLLLMAIAAASSTAAAWLGRRL